MGFTKSIKNQTDVALKITKHLLQTQGKDTNIVYSPLSIHIVLSLIAAGTKGPTLHQMLTFLNSNSTDELNSLASELIPRLNSKCSIPGIGIYCTGSSLESRSRPLTRGSWELSFANAVWVDKSLPVRPCFKQVVDMDYKAALKQADFKSNPEAVRIEVNSWIEEETKGMIKEVLPAEGAIDSETRIILSNALYFEATWEDQFNELNTKEYEFHLLDGKSSLKVPFMSTSRSMTAQFASVFNGFKVLKLRYRGNFAMYLFLPDAKDGLPDLIAKVCSGSDFLADHLPSNRALLGELRIPKFKFSFGFKACEIVKELGLELPFAFNVHGGNVTEMVYSPVSEDPYVEAIHHKSFIEVDEQGTRAAAVTLPTLRGGGGPPPFVGDFVADHPFMFLIRDETMETLLFVGQLLNPLAG